MKPSTHTGPTGPVMLQPSTSSLFSSSLVPIETNVETTNYPVDDACPPPEDPPQPEANAQGVHHLNGAYTIKTASLEEQKFRHAAWSRRRQESRHALQRCHAGRGRLERWDGCGSDTQLYWHKSGSHVLAICFCCHDRFCWPCARTRSRRIAENLSRKIILARSRFLTLTLSSDDTPLSQQITRLYRCFKTLRQDQWWGDNVTGGAAFLEVTLNKHTNRWHPHLHPLVQGNYLPQSVLSRKWLALTGNSPIVHIKLVPDARTIANYVCKYASKCIDDSVFDDPDKLQELMISLGGRRLCLTFGDWRGWKLLEAAQMDLSEYKSAGSLLDLTDAASSGDQFAQRTLANCRKNLKWQDLQPETDEYGDPLT